MTKLERAEFFSHTNNDNKDHDTGIYVTVMSSGNNTRLASIENADSSGDDSREYKDGSDHPITLHIDAPGASKEACEGFKTKVSIKTNGHDTWRFNGTVTLFFDDGTNITKTKDSISLTDNGASVIF